MTDTTKPPVIGIALRSWADAWRAVAAMPLAAFAALVAVTVLTFANLWIIESMIPAAGLRFADLWLGVRANLVATVMSVLQCIALTPLGIVVHRHVLLGQTTRGYPMSLSNARFLRYAAYAAVVCVMMSLPAIAHALIVALSPDVHPIWAMLTIYIVVVTLIVRRIALFPAIAVDANEAGWQQARLSGMGHSWRVFFTLLCATLPFAVLSVPLHFLQEWSAGQGVTGIVLFRLVTGATWIFLVCVLAAAASHLYRAFDPLLGRPAAPAAIIRTA